MWGHFMKVELLHLISGDVGDTETKMVAVCDRCECSGALGCSTLRSLCAGDEAGAGSDSVCRASSGRHAREKFIMC
ncbi:hypothetical protein SRHO_G00307260 [Serrasalmus rhombeus]